VTAEPAAGDALGREAAKRLAGLGCCEIGTGLRDDELDGVEQRYGFTFADDHRAFLAAGLPLNSPHPAADGRIHTHSAPWPDWRDGDPAALRTALDLPVVGVLHDVEHGFWSTTWGPRPGGLSARMEAARRVLAQAPAMVPVYGHRYLPGGRGGHGHPVLSMWGTDIICYGADLADYVDQEFGGRGLQLPAEPWSPTVPFWRELL
jgi:hypothetical protein